MERIMIGQTMDRGGARPVYVPVYEAGEAPEGIVFEGPTVAPVGMIWMHNGKSRLHGEHLQWLVRIEEEVKKNV